VLCFDKALEHWNSELHKKNFVSRCKISSDYKFWKWKG